MILVLLPGMDGTGDLFGPLVAAFGDELELRVVGYPTGEKLDYRELETFTRERLPTQGNFVLVAESFSGPIAISLAASRPAGLVGLVLCNTFARNPHPELAALAPLVNFLPLKLAPVAVLSRVLLGRFSTPYLESTFRSALSQVPASVLRARIKAVVNVDVTARLREIRIPLLCLVADQDEVVPRATATYIAEVVPTAQIVVIAGPHFLLQAAPVAAAAAIRAFLPSCEKASGGPARRPGAKESLAKLEFAR